MLTTADEIRVGCAASDGFSKISGVYCGKVTTVRLLFHKNRVKSTTGDQFNFFRIK
jgi:hypothetical protein